MKGSEMERRRQSFILLEEALLKSPSSPERRHLEREKERGVRERKRERKRDGEEIESGREKVTEWKREEDRREK